MDRAASVQNSAGIRARARGGERRAGRMRGRERRCSRVQKRFAALDMG
jgi:hypothetical protein